MRTVTINEDGRCSLCGKDLTKSLRLFGKHNTEELHQDLHNNSLGDLAYHLAAQLAFEGHKTPSMEELRKLDPEEYDRKVHGPN